MDAISPKDAFVESIAATDGSLVKIGDAILSIDSLEEDLRVARIQAFDDLRVILAERLADPFLSANRGLQRIVSDSAAASLPEIQQIQQAAHDGVEIGAVPPGPDLAVQQTVVSLQQQKSSNDLQLQLFDLQVKESGQINDLAANQLKNESLAANALRSRTKIAATTPGKLTLNVTAGQFIRRGHVLFSIS